MPPISDRRTGTLRSLVGITRPSAKTEARRPDFAAPAVDARRPWRIENQADSNVPEVWLYDEIGGWGVWASEFSAELSQIDAPEIVVRINSCGGDVFDGIAIMNALISHPANITVKVDGLAASIASVIALAGNKIVMGHSAQMMIHNASTMAWGEAAELRQTADLLDQISGVIAQAYADRTGTPVEEWAARMDAETWLTAQDCVSVGLADEVTPLPTPSTGEPVGDDPDPSNRLLASPVQLTERVAVAHEGSLRPAARADVEPVDAGEGGSVRDAADDPEPAGGYDVALVGQIMGWALAVDQHVDRLIAECAAALKIENPDVDNDGEPPALPAGAAGIAYALGILGAVDSVVDSAQVVLSDALGIENPDEDDDEPARPGPAMAVDPPIPPDTPGTGATADADAWAAITSSFTTPADPGDVFATQEGAWWS